MIEKKNLFLSLKIIFQLLGLGRNDSKNIFYAVKIQKEFPWLGVIYRLERWVHRNLRQFNTTKCKVLHLDWGSPWCQHGLLDEGIESSPAKREMGVLVDERLYMSW